MQLEWVIYVLKDPRDERPRYVGWTSVGIRRRLQAHIQEARTEARQAHTHKTRWIRGLLSGGLRPVIETIDHGTGPNWGVIEQLWILLYREQYPDLTNLSDGGEGNLGYVPTPEVREKISRANKGRKLTPEHIAKWIGAARLANMKRKWTPEERQRLSQRLKGIPRPPGVMEKAQAAKRGSKMSEEGKAKLRVWHLGRKASLETRAKMSKSHVNNPIPIESKLKQLVATARSNQKRHEDALERRAAKERLTVWERPAA